MHILLLVNSYVTPEHPALGALYQLHVKTYRQAKWQVGVAAVKQRNGKRLQKPWMGRPWLEFHEEDGVPVYLDYTWQLAGRVSPPIPVIGRPKIPLRVRIRLATRAVDRYISEFGRPDIVHAHSSRYAGLVAVLIKRKYDLPYVLSEHMTHFARGAVPSSEIPLVKQAFEVASARLPVSPHLGEVLESTLGDVVKPWISVPNMVDGDFFRLSPAHKNRPAENQHIFTFLNVGRMQAVKAQDDLLRAFASRFKDTKRCRLKIGGDGPLRQQLLALAKELRIEDQVDFMGNLSRKEVASEMQQADVYVLASHHETFAIPLIESLACGTPIVATACVGPEGIVNKENGILVEPGDIESLAEAMVRVHDNITDYNPAQLRDDCLHRFGTQAVLERLAAIYASVLRSR